MDVAGLSQETLQGLLRFARALTGDRGLAEDIVQETLLRLMRRSGEPIDNVEAYARRMIVNSYVSWRRKWARQIPVAEVEPDTTEPDPSDRLADLDVLRRRLDELTPKQRAAIVLRYLEDRTDEDIAQLLQCSQNAVRSLVSRGLASMRIDQSVATEGRVT